ncbi:uncharacterized protein LOC106637623 isoform X2 [Copidosoma floridanum]|uniref:uncharacterized protein LOC106637623 isoform X2 n=1 Tax=Copidosoma floridanum TaxID=29053 RepID=UPI000C6F6262|nr:uncharacterized protein LOC106637623 isoform X2 [Copidosoma floridanum]
MAIPLKTEDKLEYHFYPVSGRQIQFRVQAAHDAHIALTSAPSETDNMLEIFIGGWQNTKSVIRKNRTKPEVAEVETVGILDANKLLGFWIRWNDNIVTVGKENEPEPLLVYENIEPLEITHFGVCTGWGASGEWLIEERCIIYGDEGAQDEAQAEDISECIPLSNYSWVEATYGVVPPGAMVAGEDGEPLYVGRAHHEGALLPGKVKPTHAVCYVPFDGQEIPKQEYEILCNCNGTWTSVSGSDIPPNAILGGTSESGEPLYIGRVDHENTKTPGKVHPSHECLFIPYGGEELRFQDYEILVE